MSKIVLKNPQMIIDGTDLTTRISSITMDLADDEVDASTFGSTWKETAQGMSDASMGMTFTQDFALTMVDATLWPIKNTAKKVLVVVAPEKLAVAKTPTETNPAFLMGAQLYGYSPLSGGVGELSTTDPTFKNCTQYGILRAISKAKYEEYETQINAKLV